MIEPIRGKVAQILDSRQAVLNVGLSQNVAAGMVFKVVNPEGEQIRDPDSNQILGSVESPKVLIRVIDVQEKLSVATMSAANPTIAPATLGPFARVLMPPTWVDQYESLGTDLNGVSIGDSVIQVFDMLDK